MRQQQRRSLTIWGTLRVDDFHRRILWSRAAQLINPIASGGHIRYPNLELHPWGGIPLQTADSLRSPWSDESARALLLKMFDSAVASANPLEVLADYLPERPRGRCVVVGAGKAATAMAQAVDRAWADLDLSGVVVAPYGYGGRVGRICVLEARHPVPDEASEAAARQVLQSVAGLSPDDLVLALISGGGSSTLALPAPGLSLADKQQTNRVLLKSGLDIRTMNVIRRRLSGIKGGRLAAAAAPARVVTLGISDIPGDEPSAIASGPTLPDLDKDFDFREVLSRIGPMLPRAVVSFLERPFEPVTLPHKPDFRMIATPAKALAAAAAVARAAGVKPIVLGDAIEGEASELGRDMAHLALAPVGTPTVYLSGGETTVTIGSGPAGCGGRNTEFLLALASALRGTPGVWGLAADTDGEDGANGGAAGAIIDPSTLARARVRRTSSADALLRHDSGGFFETLGDLVMTGPTHTNVNDFRAILVVPLDGH